MPAKSLADELPADVARHVHPDRRKNKVQTIKYVYWQEDDAWLGYLQDYPDYWTQGETLADLLDHLADLNRDLNDGYVPGACGATPWTGRACPKWCRWSQTQR